MYILYKNGDDKGGEFGIWKVSKDLNYQTCIFYSDDSLTCDGQTDLIVEPLEYVTDKTFNGGEAKHVNIITEKEKDDLIFLTMI